MKILDGIFLVVCICICGCALIVKHPCDLIITNAVYGGPYCLPGGCRGDLHYQANTEVEIGVLDGNTD